ncbi:MAG: mechanosensitive ion channel family protein [Cyclobacteriaceae bacterium]
MNLVLTRFIPSLPCYNPQMRSFIAVFILLGALWANAQNQDNLNPFYLSSPYKSIHTHLFYLQPENYDINIAKLPFVESASSNKEAERSAIMLKQLLDGKGLFIDMNVIPMETHYVDSTTQEAKYVLAKEYPNIFLVEAANGNWIFNRQAIGAIKKAHEDVFILGTSELLSLLPKLGSKKLLGLYYYQYVGIFILIFLAVVTHKIFSIIINTIFIKGLKAAGYEMLADGYLLPIARPASMFFITLLILLFYPALQLPPATSRYILVGLQMLLPIFGTIMFYKMIDVLSLYLLRLAEKTKSTLDDQLVPLLRKTLKTFIVAIGMLLLLDNLDIEIMPLLAGLSIGGLAFALAAQDTIKNFFGSLMIFIDKPFQIGDWITSDNIDGTVEEVGFRSSRIRTFRNSVMYVPNGNLADTTIDNHGLRNYRRFYTTIGINYDTPPHLMQTFVEGLRKIVQTHPDTNKNNYHVYFNDLAGSSLNIMFYIFIKAPDWGNELRARHEILLEIMKLAETIGVNFAFPTQTVHMVNFPGKPSLSPTYSTPDKAIEDMEGYFKNPDNGK